MAALTVLSVAFPFARVGPDAVGGAEQILSSLDGALARRGDRSIVIAQRGSVVRGELVPMPILDPTRERERAHEEWRRAIEAVIERELVDVVHVHALDFHAYLSQTRVPSVCTLHLPCALYPRECFERAMAFVCVSQAQRRTCPVDARVIENGVELELFEPRIEKGRYVLALGRICEEKGYHLAIDAARRAGLSIVIAGRVYGYDEHVRYFERELRPRLGRDACFLGPVGPRARRRLLARARALLVPSTMDETSSLVSMEALASATPVVAFARGALPEVIEHAHTGFVVSDVEAMSIALTELDRIDPRACRHAAETRFRADRMHEGYLALYRDLAHGAAREVA